MKIGIYNPNLSTKGGGEKVCLALAETLSPGNEVTILTHATLAKSDLEAYFGVNLAKTQISLLKEHRFRERLERSRVVPQHLKKMLKNYAIYKSAKKMNLDVFVNNAYNTDIPAAAPMGVYMCMFPQKLLNKAEMGRIKRFYINIVDTVSRWLMYPGKKDWLETYQRITANSKFTQGYIKKYWNRDSDIIYPISDDMMTEGVEKESIIVNVGRFFHNNGITHHKRQDFLIDTFIKMKDLHKKGWELHVAGTLNDNPADMAYVIDLLKRSDGYPIKIHLDTPLHELGLLYSRAKIYWHATGYGADQKKNPERQEHFGISTVEAMSAGAVPIVIASAGQKESVREGVNGYLWDTEKELIAKTRKLIESNDFSRLEHQARHDAKRFDKAAFRKQTLEVFEHL